MCKKIESVSDLIDLKKALNNNNEIIIKSKTTSSTVLRLEYDYVEFKEKNIVELYTTRYYDTGCFNCEEIEMEVKLFDLDLNSIAEYHLDTLVTRIKSHSVVLYV